MFKFKGIKMIKKLAQKIKSFLLKLKRNKKGDLQSTVIDSIIDNLVESVDDVAKEVEEAIDNLTETAKKEADDVVKAATKKKPAKKATANTTPKKRGRPKKSE
jgi:gas vesicle protein